MAEQREKLKENILKRTLAHYGLTRAEYDRMVAAGCTICGGPPKGVGRYHFDHDHATGTFRGLLCNECNTGLGKFCDDPALLRRALSYLAPREG